MSRWRAFGIHLFVSAIVAIVLLLFILNLWFPGILARIDGGWTGLKIVMGVDVVLGPLLTLVVFKAGKPGLKFDMGCIFTAQLLCLTAGIWVVYNERPLALVYAFDGFYSLAAKEFEQFGKDTAVLDAIPGRKPKLVLVQLPDDQAQAAALVLRSQFTGDPLFIQTDRWVTFPESGEPVMARMSSYRTQAEEELGLDAAEIEAEDCLFTRFVSAHNEGYVCFDDQRRKLIRFYD